MKQLKYIIALIILLTFAGIGYAGDFIPKKFLQLRDTPSTYAGSGGFCLKVNVGTTALEFVACETGSHSSFLTSESDPVASAWTYSNIVGLWTTCTGYLKSDGTCVSLVTMTYPGAGVPVSTGSAWDASLSTDGSGDCGSGAVCLGDHTHSSYAPLASPQLTGTPAILNGGSLVIKAAGDATSVTLGPTVGTTLGVTGTINATGLQVGGNDVSTSAKIETITNKNSINNIVYVTPDQTLQEAIDALPTSTPSGGTIILPRDGTTKLQTTAGVLKDNTTTITFPTAIPTSEPYMNVWDHNSYNAWDATFDCDGSGGCNAGYTGTTTYWNFGGAYTGYGGTLRIANQWHPGLVLDNRSGGCTKRVIASMNRTDCDTTGCILNVETTVAHGYLVGQFINVSSGSGGEAGYDGNYYLLTVPTTTTFTAKDSTSKSNDASASLGTAPFTGCQRHTGFVMRQDGASKWAIDKSTNTYINDSLFIMNYTSGSARQSFYIDDVSNYIAIHETTGEIPPARLWVHDAKAKTANFTHVKLDALATSSTASTAKVGLNVQSTGTWNGSTSTNTGINVDVSGGSTVATGIKVAVSGSATNYAAIFTGGNVGIGTTAPTVNLTIAAPAQTGVAEILQSWSVSDEATAKLTIENSSAVDNYFTARIHGVSDGNETALQISGTSTTDSGTSPVVRIDARQGAAVVTVRPLFEFSNYSTRILGIPPSNGELDIYGVDTGAAILGLKADRGDDASDTWFLKSMANGDFSLQNDTTTPLTGIERFGVTKTGIFRFSTQSSSTVEPNYPMQLYLSSKVLLADTDNLCGTETGGIDCMIFPVITTIGYGRITYIDATDGATSVDFLLTPDGSCKLVPGHNAPTKFECITANITSCSRSKICIYSYATYSRMYNDSGADVTVNVQIWYN